MTTGFGPHELLECYRRGVFPMAESQDDPDLYLIDPDTRGVLPLKTFHIPTRLKKTVRHASFTVRIDTAFSQVMEACAEPGPGRENTWINPAILNLYSSLHRDGHAHSVECWNGEQLVGGLYGVSIGGAFFGESMFSRANDSSKIALVHLVARLLEGGYALLDAQFHNQHLEQFGLVEISRDAFRAKLADALDVEADFYSCDVSGVSAGGVTTGDWAVQRITQMS
ncbi:MAG: leucyl/phenylalanyl-tRNA--protein transferase [Hyphomonadaceae bacterium]